MVQQDVMRPSQSIPRPDRTSRLVDRGVITKVLDLRDSEAKCLVDHGFATAVEDEAPKPKRAARKPKAGTQSETTDTDGASSPSETADSE